MNVILKSRITYSVKYRWYLALCSFFLLGPKGKGETNRLFSYLCGNSELGQWSSSCQNNLVLLVLLCSFICLLIMMRRQAEKNNQN